MINDIGIRIGILASLLVFGSWADGLGQTCADNINSRLCEQLQAMKDTDWVICQIHLQEVPFGPPSCAKEDTACQNHSQDTSWMQLKRDSILAETRLLFNSYDLRWPDDPQTRASVPTADGRWDTISNRYHIPGGTYIVYVTKQAILSIVKESYILDAENWVRTGPTGLLSRPEFRARRLSFSSDFNLKGQRIEGKNPPGFKVMCTPVSR